MTRQLRARKMLTVSSTESRLRHPYNAPENLIISTTENKPLQGKIFPFNRMMEAGHLRKLNFANLTLLGDHKK